MENQHRKIKGYRELSQEEIDLMNEVKAKGAELGELVAKVQEYLDAQTRQAQRAVQSRNESGIDASKQYEEVERLRSAEPQRWAATAKTDLQKGLMALTRSIAQPEFF